MKLTDQDKARLKGVNPRLVNVLLLAASKDVVPFRVLEGVRTLERQKVLKAQGSSKTLASKHIPGEDGYGRAVDLVPLPVDWNNKKAFKALKAVIMQAAKELGVKVRSGSDWDSNGIPDEEELTAYIKKFGHKPLVDWPHFELIG